MNKERIIVVKDLRGYRLVLAEYDGQFYKLSDTGEIIGDTRAFPADQDNLLAMMGSGTLHTVSETMLLPLKVDQVAEFTDDHGFGITEELRLVRKMGPPFTKVKAGHVRPMIEMHLALCEQAKQEPEKVPITLLWVEEEVCMVVGPAIGKVPEFEGGKISVADGKLLVLSHMDYHLVPKMHSSGAFGGVLVKYGQAEPTNAETVEEAIGPGRFLTIDGVLTKSGNNKLVFSNISIEDIIGKIEEGGGQ